MSLQFGFEDEDMLVAMAGHLGAAIDLMHASTESPRGVAAGCARGAGGRGRRAAAAPLRQQ